MLSKSLRLALLCLLVCYSAYTQQININQLSPQTYEFVKYGNVPVSHFTGESNLKIPLYTYTDRDFELPIHLGYNSSGFIPNKREGIVGLNWYLNAGGVITRRVNGWPDERAGAPTTMPTELHGLYYGIKNNLGVKTKTKAQIFDPSIGTVSPTLYWHIDGCEVEPDDFMFNMPGCSGRFFLENNGSVRTLGNKPYKVDLSGFAIQPQYAGNTVNDSEIIITTDNGYVYYFGGSMQYLEVSYPLPENGPGGYPVINAWHLRKIEAPNGRTVVYEYKPFIEGFVVPDRDPEDPYHYLLTAYNVEYSQAESTCNDFAGGTCSYVGGSSGFQTVREATKTVYLEKIKIDKISIEFSYGEKEKAFYTDENQLNQKTLQLNTMYVKSEGVLSPLKRFDFGYTYLGGSQGERQFLTSLKEMGVSPYSFTYYKTSELPNPKTSGLDHWGFWNGSYSTTSPLIPAVKYYPNGDVEMESTLRDPNTTKADVGLLQRVTYPTGGYTEFFYEGHSYTKRLERRSSGNFVPELFNVSGVTGGARVWKIVDHDGERETNAREFKYVNNFPTGTESSGILLSWPRYIFYWKYDDGYTVQHMLKRESTSYNVNFYPGEHFIHYKEVSEVVTPSNGYVNYKFSNYESHPDFNDYKTSVVIPQSQYITNIHLYNSYVGIKLNERSFERGLPLEVTVFASKTGGTYYPVRKTVTQYQTVTNNPNDYVVNVHQTGGIAQSSKLYYYPVQPLQQSEITYSNEGTNDYTVVTNFTYTNTNFLRTRSTTLSDGRTQSVKYKYPLDFITDADDAVLFNGSSPKYPMLAPEIKALVDLKKNNVLNPPVEIINFVDNKAVSATLIYFKDFASVNLSKKVYPHKSWALRTQTPISSFAEASITKGTTWTFNKHTGYTTDPELTYDRYDEIGNLIEMTDKDQTKKSYKWNVDKLYPIAEAMAMSYDEFFHTSFEDGEGNSTAGDCRTGRKSRTGGYSKVITGISPGTYTLSCWKKQTDNSWKKETTDVTVTGNNYTISLSGQIDEVRFHPKRAAARMNTYTYDSGIGMTSKTDFNGASEFYEYDSNGRLRAIRDTNRHIQKIIEYNYKIQ